MCYNNILHYKTMNLSDTGFSLNLKLNKSSTPENLGTATLVVKQNIPDLENIYPVDITIGDNVYTLHTKSGNKFMSDQLRKNVPYLMVYGNNPKHFTVINCEVIPKTSFVPEEY